MIAAGGYDSPRRHRPDARHAQQFPIACRIDVHREEPGLSFSDDSLGVTGKAQPAILIEGELYLSRREGVDPDKPVRLVEPVLPLGVGRGHALKARVRYRPVSAEVGAPQADVMVESLGGVDDVPVALAGGPDYELGGLAGGARLSSRDRRRLTQRMRSMMPSLRFLRLESRAR